MKVGKTIKELRKDKGLTQAGLAKLLNIAPTTVSSWERGENRPLMDKITILAEIFNVPVSYFFPGNSNNVENILSTKTKKVPMLGTIAAGEPIFAEENCTAYIEVDSNMHVDFCLKVQGDSMIDARIHDKDVVFIRKQAVVENGEIAAVMIDGEVTLKRFYKNNGGVILKPENRKYQPWYYSAKDFKQIHILGKAIFFQSWVI